MKRTVSKKAEELILWLREYASHRINCQVIDERRCIPPYIALDFGNQGLLGMQVSKSYGGLELSTFDFLKICEQLSGIDLGLTLFAALHNILAIRPIQLFASKAMQDKWLPLLASGRSLGAFALTEPAAGSNPKGIMATGIPIGPGTWSVTGHKIWSGSASWSNVINVFVKIKDQNEKNLGITGFVVEQGTKGLKMGEEALTMGMRGMVQNAIFLNDVPVYEANILGSIGKGLEVAQEAMLYGRLAISTACIGAMKRCMQLIKRYTERRKVGASLLIKNGVILTKIRTIAFYITVLESLIYKSAELIDKKIEVPQEIYCACKILGPEMLWFAVDTLVQCLGGRGYIETNIASRFMRDARIFRIFEGPTETLLQFVGVNLLYNNKPLLGFLREHFQAPDIADSLPSDIQKVNESVKEKFFMLGREQRDHIAANYAGELGAWAIALASLDKINEQQAYVWANELYQEKLSKACLGNDSIDLGINLDEILTRYGESIGDIEESLPGVDVGLDSLLLKTF